MGFQGKEGAFFLVSLSKAKPETGSHKKIHIHMVLPLNLGFSHAEQPLSPGLVVLSTRVVPIICPRSGSQLETTVGIGRQLQARFEWAKLGTESRKNQELIESISKPGTEWPTQNYWTFEKNLPVSTTKVFRIRAQSPTLPHGSDWLKCFERHGGPRPAGLGNPFR